MPNSHDVPDEKGQESGKLWKAASRKLADVLFVSSVTFYSIFLLRLLREASIG